MKPFEGFKVITASAMQALEQESIEAGADSLDYMVRAASGITAHCVTVLEHHPMPIYLLVGKGNNGGDALATGAFLKKKGFEVEAYLLFNEEALSTLSQKQLTLFKEQQGKVTHISHADQINFSGDALVIDGIFGTGFSGDIKEPIKSYIDKVNSLDAYVVAIDIPSGIHGDTGKKLGSAIDATQTCFLGMPKLGFFLHEGFDHVGQLISVDFGLCPSFTARAKAEFCLINPEAVYHHLPPLKRTTYKYQAGHVGVVATSPSMEGAGLLAAKACYRAGAGLVRLFIPQDVDPLFFAQLPEAITVPFTSSLVGVMQQRARFKALVVGPGLSEENAQIKHALTELWQQEGVPMVIDAGALHHLKAQFESPHNKAVILTPHRGEMSRLLGKEVQDSELKQGMQAYVEKHKVVLVLKGAPTFIFAPGQVAMIVPFGSPGMATGGSGDVLSGVLGALLAKGLPPRQAAMMGVYFHAQAGEQAASRLSEYSLLASDLIDQLPEVIDPCY